MKEAMEEALGDGQYSKQSKAVKHTCMDSVISLEKNLSLELNCKINPKDAMKTFVVMCKSWIQNAQYF